MLAQQQLGSSSPSPPPHHHHHTHHHHHHSSDGTSNERKDFDRFVKFFTFKCAQVVVQSRLGSKVKTASKPASSGADWFNLTIDDNEEILNQTKRALEASPFGPDAPLTIEISLKPLPDETANSPTEGDVTTPETEDETKNSSLILELWRLSFDEQDVDINVRVQYTVYNRLSLLLKSLITVTRVFPAYKLSRRMKVNQENDFSLYYNVYCATPLDSQAVLGEGAKFVHIGKVGTPFGSLSLDVDYRTKLEQLPTESPTGLLQQRNLMIKSDHYAMPVPPPAAISSDSSSTQEDGSMNKAQAAERLRLIPAFATSSNDSINNTESTEPIPFANLLQKSQRVKATKYVEPKDVQTASASAEDETRVQSSSSSLSSTMASADGNPSGGENPDDFILVSLKTPFAALDIRSDPFNLFHECQQAPVMLQSHHPSTVEESAAKPNDPIVTEDELTRFESNIQEYDDFVSQLCHRASQFSGTSSSSTSS